MSTLEDKLLGEKKEYYCSSSEGEDEQDESEDTKGEATDEIAETSSARANHRLGPDKARSWEGSSRNTGPKGVLADWELYQAHQIEVRNQREQELVALTQQASLTCLTEGELAALNQKDQKEVTIEDLYSSDELAQFLKKRMQEMHEEKNQLPHFSGVEELSSGDDYLKLVDQTNPKVTVMVHLYEQRISECATMNECLLSLSSDYPSVKFCKIRASAVGVSHLFKSEGIPALLVYKGGNLVGNFVRLKDEFGSEFYAGDVENYLIENGMLEDKNNIPTLLK